MQPLYNLKKQLKAIVMTVAGATLLVSCGTYQQASYYDNDGIYGSSSDYDVADNSQNQQATAPENENGEAYKNYFEQKAEEVAEVQDGDVFTDINSYSSNNATEEDTNIQQEDDSD